MGKRKYTSDTACESCGGRPVRRKGLCDRCYQRKETVRSQKKKWEAEHKEQRTFRRRAKRRTPTSLEAINRIVMVQSPSASPASSKHQPQPQHLLSPMPVKAVPFDCSQSPPRMKNSHSFCGALRFRSSTDEDSSPRDSQLSESFESLLAARDSPSKESVLFSPPPRNTVVRSFSHEYLVQHTSFTSASESDVASLLRTPTSRDRIGAHSVGAFPRTTSTSLSNSCGSSGSGISSGSSSSSSSCSNITNSSGISHDAYECLVALSALREQKPRVDDTQWYSGSNSSGTFSPPTRDFGSLSPPRSGPSVFFSRTQSLPSLSQLGSSFPHVPFLDGDDILNHDSLQLPPINSLPASPPSSSQLKKTFSLPFHLSSICQPVPTVTRCTPESMQQQPAYPLVWKRENDLHSQLLLPFHSTFTSSLRISELPESRPA